MGLRALTITTMLLGIPSTGSTQGRRTVVVVPRSLSSPGERLLQRQIEASVRRGGKIKLLPWSSIQAELSSSMSDRPNLLVGPAIDKARALYLKQQFGEMQQTLAALEASHLQQLARSPQQAASVSLLLGVALASQGKADAAKQRFRFARQLFEKSELDPALYPPSIVALSKRARDEDRSATRHDLQLKVSPAAQVIIDGTRRGISSTPVAISEGFHYVVLSRLGYLTETMLLNLREPTRRKVRLRQLSPAGCKAQLARRLREGQLAADEQEAQVIASTSGASEALLWAAADQRVSAVLLHADPLVDKTPRTSRRAVVVPATSASSLWQHLTQPTAARKSPPKRRSLWTRWWVWAVAAAVVGGATIGSAVALSAETDVRVRVR